MHPPEGPKTWEDVANWPQAVLPRLTQHVLKKCNLDPLTGLDQMTVVMTTSYSGIGSAEWAMAFIKKAFESYNCYVEVEFYSACDFAPSCRRMLQQHREPPKHIFGDLQDRVPAALLEYIHKLQAAYNEELTEVAGLCRKGRKEKVAALGSEFFKECLNEFDKYPWTPADEPVTAWCYRCNQMCPVTPEISEGSLWIEVGGNTCTPWSASGARLGWLDPSSVPALAWGRWISQCRPHIIINECVPAWPAREFWEHMLKGTEFTQETLNMNPKNMGIPSCRPRSYTIVTCRGSVPMLQVSEALDVACTSSLAVDAAVYFKATPEMQLEMKREILRRRHIFFTEQNLEDIPWSRVLTFGARMRLKSHIDQSTGFQGTQRAMLVMVSQTMQFAGYPRSLVPTLVRNSLCYIVSEDRLMLPIEHFLVNGVPLFYEGLPPELQVIPQRAFEQLGLSEARRLAGNMMHLASVGSVLLAALCCYRHRVDRVVLLPRAAPRVVLQSASPAT
jgi:hypothetical protein